MLFDRDAFLKEPHPIQFELNLLFSSTDSLVICDVGACEGEDSIRFAKIFPNSKIFAFEPLPDNIDHILRNFNKSGLRNAVIYDVALSDKDETLNLYVSASKLEGFESCDWDFGNKSSSILQPEKHLDLIDFISFPREISVKSITLKTFFQKEALAHVDIMQIDVQGAELMVLKGAEEKMKDVKIIWIEVSKVELYKGQPLLSTVDQFMKSKGFMLVKDTLSGFQGDRLYLSIAEFGYYKLLVIKVFVFFRDLFFRLKRKVFGI
jgi:FkbM family methyltransferase